MILTGSLSFTEIVEWQRVNGWGFFWQFWAFPIFFIAATAEINRTPFDMVEADSEIVAGFATEYSGMRFGFFFFAEYVALFIMSTIVVTLFFGGLAAALLPASRTGSSGPCWAPSSSLPRPTSSCSWRSGCGPPCRACASTS